jgi:hypothetical protein
MAITSLKDVSAADVLQSEAALVALINGENPSLDLSRGTVVRDLLLRPAAIYHAINRTDMENLRQSFSLLNIAEDPDLADDDIVDGVLSNLRITRNEGGYATGQIRIIVSSFNATSVVQGTTFTINGLNFVVDRAFIGVTTSSNVTSTGTRLLQSRSDGNYEFLVDVTAQTVGVDSNIQAGARFTVVPAISRMIDAVAADDFSDGLTREDNATLVARAQLGISPHTLSGRSHIESLLRDNFTSIRSMSIVGFGDEEMVRDRNNIFDMSTGGKVDIYVRTADFPQTVATSVTATLVDKAAGTWQFTLDRSTSAGVYRVVGVYMTGTSPASQLDGSLLFLDSLDILSHSRQVDTSPIDSDFVPSIASSTECAFSRYQTLAVRFTDTVTAASTDAGGSVTYTAYLYKMPDIAAIQDFVNDRTRRNPTADYLVRAPIPMVCAATINILKRTSEVVVDADAIQASVSSVINAAGFSIGYLSGSKIVAAAQNLLSGSSTLDLPVLLSGILWKPDDTAKFIGETDELTVPVGLASMSVTARTVGIFLAPKDVNVNVSVTGAPEV